ncbi:MAG: 3-hydroxyacyl-CoA dehydrogenase family protein, partial [Pseudomonadota bacterium]
IGNRMIAGYSGQAREIILQGALPSQVDQALVRFGMPMGPFQMADMVGLDLGWRAAKMRGEGIDDQPDSGKIPFQLCEMERFGQKNGKGFYLYEEGSRVPRPDPEVEALIISMSKEMGYNRREIDDDEVLKRIVYALVNIGAQLLDDKIALRPGDIDIVYINGYGFPAYRGGPMHYADEIGVKNVYDDICAFQAEYGDFWKPAPLLKRLAEEGKSFASLQA